MPVDQPPAGGTPDVQSHGHFEVHPDFAAHFTSAIYDPNDAANDETAPFGGDEAADVYAEWTERAREIEGLTLRQMLELDDDVSTTKSGPSDLDETVIAAGFVHLRATGWIDREGGSWLRAALKRRAQSSPGAEFDTMLQDLATYPNRPPKVPKTRPERGWLRIRMGGGDGPLTRWCRTMEKAMAADAAWSLWWASTPFSALDMYPGLYDPEAKVSFEEEEQVLSILASAPRLARAARNHLNVVVTSDSPPLPSLMSLPNFREMLDDLLLSSLEAAAKSKGLSAPPARLPSQSS